MDLRALFLTDMVTIAGVWVSILRCSMDEIVDEHFKACRELKAKINKIDKVEHRIEGKSANTLLRWGSEFYVRMAKGQSETIVEICVTSRDLTTDSSRIFIQCFQNTCQLH